MWLLSFPVIVVVEVVYLIRHPRTFSGLAAFVGLAIGAISYFFMYKGESFLLVFITQAIGVCSYYGIKLHR